MKIFENTRGIDFPFYNGIPELSKLDWMVLAIGPILNIADNIWNNKLYSRNRIYFN